MHPCEAKAGSPTRAVFAWWGGKPGSPTRAVFTWWGGNPGSPTRAVFAWWGGKPGSPTRTVFAWWGGKPACAPSGLHQAQKAHSRVEPLKRFGAKRHKRRAAGGELLGSSSFQPHAIGITLT